MAQKRRSTLFSIRKDGVLLPKCVSLTATAALLQLLGFLFRMIPLKLSGREAVAIYQLTANAYAIFMACSLQGILLAVTGKTAALLSSGDRFSVHRLRRAGITLFLSLFLTAASPVLLFPDAVAAHLLGDIRTKAALLLLLLCILLTGIENIHKAVFLGAEQVRYANISEISELCIRIVLVTLLLLPVGKEKPGQAAFLIILAMTLSECFSVFYLSTKFKAAFPAPCRPEKQCKTDAALKQELRKTALPICGSALLNKLLFSLTNLLFPVLLMQGGLTRKAALSEFALLFSMALPLAALPSCLIIPIGSLILPRIRADLEKGNRKDCLRKAAKLLQLVSIAAVPHLLFLTFFGADFCRLLYQSTEPAPYLPLLAFSVWLEYGEITSAQLLNGLGRTFPAAASIVAEGAVLLIGSLFLLPRLGLTGFCLARILSILIAACINFQVLLRALPLKLRLTNWVLRPLLASCLSLPLPFLLCRLPLPLVPRFLLCALLFFLLYGLLLGLTGTHWLSYFTLHFWEDAPPVPLFSDPFRQKFHRRKQKQQTAQEGSLPSAAGAQKRPQKHPGSGKESGDKGNEAEVKQERLPFQEKRNSCRPCVDAGGKGQKP